MERSLWEQEGLKKLNDFLPEKIFDSHTHISDPSFINMAHKGGNEYRQDMAPLLCDPRELRMNHIPFPNPLMADVKGPAIPASDRMLLEELEADPGSVGEIIVHPSDTLEQIEERLTHPRIRGLKCYHSLMGSPDSWNAGIGEYLPEAAWEAAKKHHLVITLHMVRDAALADPGNQKYIQQMAKKYPEVVLILAHCARSFACWTGIEAIETVSHLDNVWYDFSGVCESPSMMQILKKVGVSRCLWGSDYPIVAMQGKCISLADGFYWIYPRDLEKFTSPTPIHSYPMTMENTMAVRQAFALLDLSRKDAEDFFWNNAMGLFFGT